MAQVEFLRVRLIEINRITNDKANALLAQPMPRVPGVTRAFVEEMAQLNRECEAISNELGLMAPDPDSVPVQTN